MSKLRFFVSASILIIAYFWWNKSENTQPKKSMTLKQEAATQRAPASVTSKTLKSSKIEKQPIALATEPDTESLGHECIDNLAEAALPHLPAFRKKILDDPAAPIGRWMYDKSALVHPARNRSASDFFLTGLAVAGLMSGRENPKPNLDFALELLVNAHAMDPTNAAPIIYAAYLQKQLGQDSLGQENMDKISPQDMKYESYEIDVFQHMYKHIKSPQDLLNFFQIRAEMPIVDIFQIKNFLRENQRHDFGYLMIQNQLNPNSAYHMEPNQDQITYAAGLSLIREIYPEEAKKYPNLRDLMEKSKDHPQYKLVDIKQIGKNCTPEKLQPLVDYFQQVSK